MTIKGIDVSSNDGWNGDKFGRTHTERCYGASKFVIVKATQGLTYRNPYYTAAMKRAKADGKKLGIYHYAGGNDAAREAEHFWGASRSYAGKALYCLDWESYQNNAWGSRTWCRKFNKRFKQLSGRNLDLIYTGADGAKTARLKRKCGLWFAGYPWQNWDKWTLPSWPPSYTRYCKGWTVRMWQYTSDGGTDRNVFYGTAPDWTEAASGGQTAATTTTTTTTTTTAAKKTYKQTYPARRYPKIPKDGYIKQGTKGKNAKRLQRLLNWICEASLKIDGIVGTKTIAAVRKAQKALSVDVDGKFGAKTLRAAKKFKI